MLCDQCRRDADHVLTFELRDRRSPNQTHHKPMQAGACDRHVSLMRDDMLHDGAYVKVETLDN